MVRSVTQAPLRDVSGAITGVVVALADVTHARRLAQEVATHARENVYLQGVAEREVLRQLGSGQSNQEIARTLNLSVGALRLHVKRILAKLGVATRTQAAMGAWRHWHLG
jgi:two-component system, NarL family, response regulator LiaR